jgi:peptide/nickel transport system permease protein
VFGMIVRRLVALVPVLVIVSFAVFMLSALVPGDPAVTLAGGVQATPERVAQVRDQLGLDDPLIVQYGRWAGNAVQLDFGHSLYSDRTTVAQDIADALPVTLSIALAALLVAVVVGLPVGIVAGLRPGALPDRVSVTGTAVGLAIPNFVLAILLITLFAVNRDWFPALGYTKFSQDPGEWLRSITLPALSLGLVASASIARQVRGSIIDVVGSAYVRTAWATGLSPTRVIGKHALKNAAIPAVTQLGLQFSVLLGGSAIIERLFSIPGLGSLLLNALYSKDLPVIQGVVITFVIIFVALNLLLDIVYGYLNPKIRVS